MSTGGPAAEGQAADHPMAGRGGLMRATGAMAVGTLLSRLTGLLRTLATVYALGFVAVSGDYNLANTIPNMVVDLVLGGILAATFVPVFVERLAGRDEDEAWAAISAVVSVALLAIAVASVLFLVAAPLVVDVLTGLNSASGSGADRRLATDLLVLFVPQLACYGFLSLATAVLNARRRFAAPMFVPIVNNVVLIAVLVAFRQVVGAAAVNAGNGAATVLAHRSWILLLGVGTTAGVVLQTVALVPALRSAGLHLRWAPRLGHEAVRTVVRLSGWTVGLVVANQVALTVVLVLSEAIGPRAVSAYTYAWQFFQLPFGVVTVSIMTAVAPDLAHRWTVGDVDGFRRRLASGLRALLTVIIPAAGAMAILAHPAVALLGHATHQSASADTAQELAVLALGLPGFSVFLYAIRVLQSIQDMRSAFWLYALENAVNVVLAAALYRPLGVRGIAASIAAAYTVAALVALHRLRQQVHGLDGEALTGPLRRVVVATAVLLVCTGAGVSVSGSSTGPALLGRVVLGAVAGLVGFLAALAAANALARRHRLQAAGAGGTLDPHAEALAGGVAVVAPVTPPRGTPAEPGPGAASPGPRQGAGPTGTVGRRETPGGGGQGTPGRPDRLPPAGRPPLRPDTLGPVRRPDGPDHPRGRLAP